MLLYHYTTIDAAINIIRNGLCFWGFRYDSMNDPTDYIFAKNLILPKLLQDMSDNEREEIIDMYPYTVSFCKKSDYHIMWRLYHAEIALVIDTDKFPFEEWNKPGVDISDNILCGDIKYATEDTIVSVATELYQNLKDRYVNDSFLDWHLSVFPFIKHNAYDVEDEYRLAKFDYDSFNFKYNHKFQDNYEIYEGEIPKDIKCLGSKDGTLRFYKEFQLPKECLRGIILHTFDEEKYNLQKKHFELWLLQNGFSMQDVKIEKTQSYPVRY